MGTQENTASATRFLEEVMNRGNLSVIDELSAPNFVDHSAPPGISPTNEGFKAFVAMFRSAFPDLHYTLEESIAEGDRVAQRTTAHGTMKGDFHGDAGVGEVRHLVGDPHHPFREWQGCRALGRRRPARDVSPARLRPGSWPARRSGWVGRSPASRRRRWRDQSTTGVGLPTAVRSGGEGGIRTHGYLRISGFQDRRNRPLCHLSAAEDSSRPGPPRGRLRRASGESPRCWRRSRFRGRLRGRSRPGSSRTGRHRTH